MERRGVRSAIAVCSAVGLMALMLVVTQTVPGSSSRADTPAEDVPEFLADACPGSTLFEPTEADPPVPNLLRVFGQRLDDYNDGRVAVLYDSYGSQDEYPHGATTFTAYPPLCGTRFVADSSAPSGGRAVSEWMFCTDRHSDVCGGTDPDGNLLSYGDIVNPLDPLSSNPKLVDRPEDEKLIAYLIQHGHSYAGVGDQAWGGVDQAYAAGSTDNRNALQTLVWCISDPADPGSTSGFAQTCEANMDADEQARLLALIPEVPTLELAFGGGGSSYRPGETATVALTTNLYHQPITVTADPAEALSVCGGPGVLTGTTLVVTGTDPEVASTVSLCLAGATVGTVDLAASASPASVSHIGWNQSRDNEEGIDPCQVFATFNEDDQVILHDLASVIFEDEATTTTTEDVATTTTTEDQGTTTTTADGGTTTTTQAGGGSTTSTKGKDLAGSGNAAAKGGTASATGTLPRTGSDLGATSVLAASFVVVGGLLVLAVRRRTQQ